MDCWPHPRQHKRPIESSPRKNRRAARGSRDRRPLRRRLPLRHRCQFVCPDGALPRHGPRWRFQSLGCIAIACRKRIGACRGGVAARIGMPALSFIFGVIVGFSLGLTGGGGAISAVPLLIYGLGLTPRDAVGTSMMTVGVTAFAGFIQRMRRGHVEIPTGILFAAAGIVGAPLGTWMAARISDSVLLGMFSLLMLVIAARMWMTASSANHHAILKILDEESGPT